MASPSLLNGDPKLSPWQSASDTEAQTGLVASSAQMLSLLMNVSLLLVLVRPSVDPQPSFIPSNTPPDTGAQPLISTDGAIVLAVNGEIYNHIKLRSELGPNVVFKTHSDCEVIIPLVPTLHISVALLHIMSHSTKNTAPILSQSSMACFHLSSLTSPPPPLAS
jgi:hypothetical protein